VTRRATACIPSARPPRAWTWRSTGAALASRKVRMKGAGPRLGGEPEPRWARRPWRAELLPRAASSIVPPAARARLGGAGQEARIATARTVAARLPGTCPPARSGRRRSRCSQTTERSARPGRDDVPAARRDRSSGRLAVAAVGPAVRDRQLVACKRVTSPNVPGGLCGLVVPVSPFGPVSPLPFRRLRSRRACGSRVAGCARIALLALGPWRAGRSGRAGHIAGGSVTGWPLQPVRVPTPSRPSVPSAPADPGRNPRRAARPVPAGRRSTGRPSRAGPSARRARPGSASIPPLRALRSRPSMSVDLATAPP
jgi:hypothetical protein